jgi:hypothetical protein
MRVRAWPVVLLLLLLPLQAGAQRTCGDLDLDGDVDADDALILRHELDASAPLTLEQALSCDVIAEIRDPGLAADPNDLAGACSLADADVMTRHGASLLPAPAPICALGAATDCCSAHAGVGCNAVNTVECVCAQDPSCCTADWDATCASLACGTSCDPICPSGSDYCGGACTSLQTDASNCGACELGCANPHGATQCAAGLCSPTCAFGWGACGDPRSGCQTLFDTNPPCPGTSLGTIEGDSDGPVVTRSGSGEAQFYFLLHDGVPILHDYITAQIRLTSPSGSNYNLSVRCFSCAPNGGPSTTTNAPAGAVDTLVVGSFDHVFLVDDSLNIVVFVTYAGGSSCGQWTLEVQGNVDVTPNLICAGN